MVAEFSLKNKTALVTGAARGIGSGIVDVFLEAGAKVAVNSLTGKYLDSFVAEMRQKYGERVFGVIGDVTDKGGAAKVVKAALADLGQIDILVNNVGDAIPGALAPSPDGKAKVLTQEEIDKVLGLNLMAAIHCTREVAGAMLARKRGRIVNISSTSAFRAAPMMSLYSAGKAALEGMTRSLAVEWAPHNVTVNAIAPGVYPDPKTMTPELDKLLHDVYLPRVPMGRFGTFRDAGLLALYLASDASGYMTGQTLTLDGGMSV